MKFSAYLSFDGQCEQAFKFYEECLGGKIAGIFRYGGSPMEAQVPSEWHNRVMHATLEVQGQTLMGADSPPGQYAKPQGFTVSLHTQDPAEADGVFQALSRNANVLMPLQETFWAKRFGMLVDQFGTPWMLNCGDEA